MKVDENYFQKGDGMKQNAVEDILSEDEKILARMKPHKKAIVMESIFKMLPIVIIWLAFDVSAIVMMAMGKFFEEEPASLWFIIPFFALHLIPVWLWIAGIVKALAETKNIEYVFTDSRIIIRSGIIGIDFKSVYYSEVDSVDLKVGVVERIFKVGDIVISAKNQTALLNNIKDPYFFLNRLQKITLDIKTDINFPNDLRPKENHGYKTEYKDKE